MSDIICDISQFTTITDWNQVKQEIKGLVIRMGYRGSVKSNPRHYGKIVMDQKFEEFIDKARAYRIPFKIYFFPTAINRREAREEGAFVLAMVKKYGITPPVWLDSEMVDKGKGRADSLSHSDRTNLLKTTTEVLENAGVACGIYASTNWLRNNLDMSRFSMSVRLNTWVAEYGQQCSYNGPYCMWQYTDVGNVKGIDGGADLSIEKALVFAKEKEVKRKTNIGLLEYAKSQVGKPYWFGTFGQTANDALYRQKKKQFPSYYTSNDFGTQYGKRVHDCAGLIKGYVWSDTPTSTPKYVASQDLSASAMYTKSEYRGKIDSLPNIPGTLVFNLNFLKN